jgi:hypothetical protein
MRGVIMIRWKIEKCGNGYVVTYPRESSPGLHIRDKAILKDWGDVLMFLGFLHGECLHVGDNVFVGGFKVT